MRRKILAALAVASVMPVLFSIYIAASLIEESLGWWMNPQMQETFDIFLKFPSHFRRDREKITEKFLRLNFPGIFETGARIDGEQMDAMERELNELYKPEMSVNMIKLTSDPYGDEELAFDPRKAIALNIPLYRGESGLRYLSIQIEDRSEMIKNIMSVWETAKVYRHFRQHQSELKRALMMPFSILLFCALLVSLGFGFLLSRNTIRRINRLIGATEKITKGDYSGRIEGVGQDELGRLEKAFNEMTGDMAEARDRISHLEKMGVWREVARKLAHEIKNPLTPIQLVFQELKSSYRGEDETYKSFLNESEDILREEIDHLKSLVRDFSTLGQIWEPRFKLLDFREVIREYEKSFIDYREKANLRIEMPDTPLPVKIDKDLFKRIIVNLLDNAVEAGAERAEIEIKITKVAGKVEIRVGDDGSGIPEEEFSNIFEPYFTTKAEGTGLGLAIVKKMVLDHNGVITAANKATGGAEFKIRIPLSDDASGSKRNEVGRKKRRRSNG